MFSVVIPLYNKEKSIFSTIESVLNQTIQDFEIIVVNDGSTDKSAEQAEKFDDNRIRIIYKENGGVSSARNRGISEANYDWIALLDGDDLWAFNHLETIKGMINLNFDAHVFATEWEQISKQNIQFNSNTNKIYMVNDYFKESLERGSGILCSSVVVIHKKCFKNIGGFHEALTHGEDLLLWAKLSLKYKIIKSLKVTAYHRVEAENRAMHIKGRTFNNEFIDKLLALYKSNKIKSLKLYINKKVVREIREGLKNGHNQEVFKNVIKYKNYLGYKQVIIYVAMSFLPIRIIYKLKIFTTF